MKKTTACVAAALLLGTTGASLAGSKSGGASAFTPAQDMKSLDTKPTKGASEYSPGDQMRDLATKPKDGASDFTPGDKMNDKRKK